ncbi:putative leucine-rich repeat-containing protein DDB_G0290503 [Centruroides vittatus]|uniref:putative leucine-rich repeat-containing protein DDB_G0290503 n=1 Tax=Centruroides vittatus TaxID=120091 RepID=UPI00351011D5
METRSFTLNQLIDISLSTPEIGVVNFKILRNVLKVIVRELDIHDVKARVLVKDLQEAATFMLSADKSFIKTSPKESIAAVKNDASEREVKSEQYEPSVKENFETIEEEKIEEIELAVKDDASEKEDKSEQYEPSVKENFETLEEEKIEEIELAVKDDASEKEVKSEQYEPSFKENFETIEEEKIEEIELAVKDDASEKEVKSEQYEPSFKENFETIEEEKIEEMELANSYEVESSINNDEEITKDLILTGSTHSEISSKEEIQENAEFGKSKMEELNEESGSEFIQEHVLSIISSLKGTKSPISSTQLKSTDQENADDIESSKQIRKNASDDIRKRSDTFCSGNRWLVSNMWKTVNFSKRINALETGVEKIVCSLNVHAKSIDRQRREFEYKKKTDNIIKINIEENILRLFDSLNSVSAKLEMFVLSEEYLTDKNETDSTISDILTDLDKLLQLKTKMNDFLYGDRNFENVRNQVDVLEDRVTFLEVTYCFCCFNLKKKKKNSFFKIFLTYRKILAWAVKKRRYILNYATIERNYETMIAGSFDLATLGRLEVFVIRFVLSRYFQYEELIKKVQPIIEKFENDDLEDVNSSNLVGQVMNCRFALKKLAIDIKKQKDTLELLQCDLNKQIDTTEMLVCAQERGFTPDDKEIFYEMQKRLNNVEKDCEKIEAIEVLLIEEMQSTISQIKFIKANKDETENALKNKADIQDVNEKVSKNDYDLMLNDVTNGLQELMTKFASQEQDIQRMIKNLTDGLNNKVDAIKLENVSESFQKRINALAIKMKQMKTIMESEAPIPAGTKLQIAKCISCERPTKIHKFSYVRSSPFQINELKMNLNDSPMVTNNNKNFVPNTEYIDLGRAAGGSYTTFDSEATKFPSINEERNFSGYYK